MTSEKNNHCFGLRTGCAIGVCTDQHDHDRRNYYVDETVDHNRNNNEHNLRDGTVSTYEPGKTIVVRGEQGPVSFALGTAANIVNGAGKV